MDDGLDCWTTAGPSHTQRRAQGLLRARGAGARAERPDLPPKEPPETPSRRTLRALAGEDTTWPQQAHSSILTSARMLAPRASSPLPSLPRLLD